MGEGKKPWQVVKPYNRYKLQYNLDLFVEQRQTTAPNYHTASGGPGPYVHFPKVS